MSTGGGFELSNLKIHSLFSQMLVQVRSFRIFFSDILRNPENPGKCPDCPAYEGVIKFDRN
jgi:hypothetical protein